MLTDGVAFHHCLEHLGLGQLIRARLNHEHRIARTGDNQVKPALFEVTHRRISDELPIEVAHLHPADWPFEGNIADGEGSRSADNRQGAGVIHHINREGGDNDLHLVLVALGEERAQGAVGEA